MKDANQISTMMRRIIGAVLLVIGVLLFVNVLDAGVPAFWLSAMITLVGVFTVSAAPTAGLAMMGIGVFMLLRDFGIIETAWLGIGFAIFLVGVGLYGLLGGMWTRHADEPVAEAKVAK